MSLKLYIPGYRIIKYGYAGLMILSLILFSACSNKSEKIYTDTVDGPFDTIHIISGYAGSEREFQKKVKFYREEMERLHKLYTAYENFEGIENIKTINDNAGIRPVKADKEIRDIIKESIKWNREVSGKVNIAAGALIEIWEKSRKEGKLPERRELENARKCSDIENISINEEEGTVFLKKECAKINLGAVAKGYAVERTAEKMQGQGMTSFIISAGGNIKAVGKRRVPKSAKQLDDLKKCKDSFCVGINLPVYNNPLVDSGNPYSKTSNSYLAKVAVNDFSVVTTGNYQRYSVIDRKVYGHVIDLATLQPESFFASVTVMTEDSGFADFMSTAFFLLTYEEGRQLVEKIEKSVKLNGESMKISVIWAMNNGEVRIAGSLINGEDYVKYNFR